MPSLFSHLVSWAKMTEIDRLTDMHSTYRYSTYRSGENNGCIPDLHMWMRWRQRPRPCQEEEEKRDVEVGAAVVGNLGDNPQAKA